MDVYVLKAKAFGVVHDIAEFTKKEDAERAKEYLQKKYGGDLIIVKDITFTSFEEFKAYDKLQDVVSDH